VYKLDSLSGAYFDIIPIQKFKYYPFDTLSNIGFISNMSATPEALVLIDTAQFKNHVHWDVFEGDQIQWSLNRGPCVLHERDKRAAYLWHRYKSQPMYFIVCIIYTID
jgi:hypothetical protein